MYDMLAGTRECRLRMPNICQPCLYIQQRLRLDAGVPGVRAGGLACAKGQVHTGRDEDKPAARAQQCGEERLGT